MRKLITSGMFVMGMVSLPVSMSLSQARPTPSPDYRHDPSQYWNANIPSSEILLFAPVAWFSEHCTGGRLDIRWQGLVHLSLLAVGFMLGLHAGGRGLRH